MGNRSPYETYRTGQWSLLGIVAVTAINIVLAVFSVTILAVLKSDITCWADISMPANSSPTIINHLTCIILSIFCSRL